jgi:uncharacterized membrane protein YeaQ/YmgE (transglycosylase-associated protein family)
MGIIAWVVLGLGAGLLANMLIPGRRSQSLVLTGVAGGRAGVLGLLLSLLWGVLNRRRGRPVNYDHTAPPLTRQRFPHDRRPARVPGPAASPQEELASATSVGPRHLLRLLHQRRRGVPAAELAARRVVPGGLARHRSAGVPRDGTRVRSATGRKPCMSLPC